MAGNPAPPNGGAAANELVDVLTLGRVGAAGTIWVCKKVRVAVSTVRRVDAHAAKKRLALVLSRCGVWSQPILKYCRPGSYNC